MNVTEAVLSRFMCSDFLHRKVAGAPSSGDFQPWRVWALCDEPSASLQAAVKRKLVDGEFAGSPPSYVLYPPV